MLSALVLDNARFANVQIENGKLVSDGTRTLALGYALPGMQESLSLPEELKLTIPDHVTLRADVTDFALGSVYSLGAADLFGDYDESDPESLEKLLSSARDLSDGMAQLLEGVEQLRDGSAQLREGLETFDEKAIQAITRLVNEDGRELAERLKALAEQGRTYRASYTGRSQQAEGELRFIYRSSSIG